MELLPEELPVEPSQQIGYWESNGSFQQMMAFQAVGTTLSFVTRRPNNVVQWEGEDALTVGEWHRIAMSVTWSTNADAGLVNVWFDGEQVVTDGAAQTLADGNPHFVQIGLLRGQIEFDDVPVILLDHALEGDSLDDVEYDALPGVGGESTGEAARGATRPLVTTQTPPPPERRTPRATSPRRAPSRPRRETPPRAIRRARQPRSTPTRTMRTRRRAQEGAEWEERRGHSRSLASAACSFADALDPAPGRARQ